MILTHRPAGRRDLIFALLTALFSILCTNFYLWGDCGMAAGAATVLLCLTAVLYLRPHRQKVTAYGLFCLLAYLAGAGSLAVSDDAATKALVIFSLLLLSGLIYLELMGLRAKAYDRPTYCAETRAPVGDLIFAYFILPFSTIGSTCYAIFHRADGQGGVRGRRTGSALLGLACALPVLMVVIPLLMSSDAAFEGLLDRLDLGTVAEIIVSILIGLFVFLLAFGRMFHARDYVAPQKAAPSDRGLEPVALCSFLGVLSAVYVVYLITQLAYFFSAFEGLLPKDFTVAQYARRGFFEMATICAINLVLIFVANLISRKQAGKAPLLLRLLSVFICVFSLVLIATALSKMCLYIGSFGLTRQRILTSVFMVFLGILFLAVIARMFWKKVPCLKIAVVAGALLLIATCYADVDRIVAGYNVRAYQSGRLETIDLAHLDSLNSAAAVPYLFELLEAEDAQVAAEAREILQDHFNDYYRSTTDEQGNAVLEPRDRATDWRSFNLARIRARDLLWDHRALFGTE
ncbi:MAG: DUF4173 domain-containing protein [Oscillospiraceae bacterium]|nr:DUF4173 domain-containing protein [Oscillospiraceae bacterium]